VKLIALIDATVYALGAVLLMLFLGYVTGCAGEKVAIDERKPYARSNGDMVIVDTVSVDGHSYVIATRPDALTMLHNYGCKNH
jgi:hypothetical protein